jgi:hypothetical protein
VVSGGCGFRMNWMKVWPPSRERAPPPARRRGRGARKPPARRPPAAAGGSGRQPAAGARGAGRKGRPTPSPPRFGQTKGGGWDSNPRPPGPQPGALPTELPPPRSGYRVPRRMPLYPLPGAPVAQWTERRTSNPRVAGSNPAGRVREPPLRRVSVFCGSCCVLGVASRVASAPSARVARRTLAACRSSSRLGHS